LGLERTATTA